MRALVLLVMCLSPATAYASTLIEADLYTEGDGLITRDTATGLDWLDLTETTGRSIVGWGTHGGLTMRLFRNASRSAWGPRLAIFAVALLWPSVAAAGWGDENWGEMIWGGVVGVPALSGPELGALALGLLVMGFFLASRNRRSPRWGVLRTKTKGVETWTTKNSEASRNRSTSCTRS